MSVYVDPSSNFHPYECDGRGKCIHCDRREVWEGWCQLHDPGTCELCDPAYDGQPNEHWPAGSRLRGQQP